MTQTHSDHGPIRATTACSVLQRGPSIRTSYVGNLRSLGNSKGEVRATSVGHTRCLRSATTSALYTYHGTTRLVTESRANPSSFWRWPACHHTCNVPAPRAAQLTNGNDDNFWKNMGALRAYREAPSPAHAVFRSCDGDDRNTRRVIYRAVSLSAGPP